MAGLDVEAVAGLPFCYLTTTGRRSGRAHEIEIWFGAEGSSLYLISGGGDRSDWVRNLLADPTAQVRVGDQDLQVSARLPLVASDERTLAAGLLHGKYSDQVSSSLDDWINDAYLVALDAS